MIKIGLIGEDPHDTLSIKNILSKKYNKDIRFCIIAKSVRGYQLDNPKTIRVIQTELVYQKCDFLIYIRDLDAFSTESTKIRKKVEWFKRLDANTGKCNLLLLNVWELEALIFADVQTLNKIYKITYQFNGDPMLIKEPKEKIIQLTRKTNRQYAESHCPKIFEQLNLELLIQHCKYFKSFITSFEDKIGISNS